MTPKARLYENYVYLGFVLTPQNVIRICAGQTKNPQFCEVHIAKKTKNHNFASEVHIENGEMRKNVHQNCTSKKVCQNQGLCRRRSKNEQGLRRRCPPMRKK